MALDCLLLTSDATVLKAVQASLSVYEVSLEVRKDVPSALELANHRHFDGFVIDCDEVPGGLGVLTEIRRTSANRKKSVILAIVNGNTGISTAFDSGAQYVVGKPIDKARLRPFLETAIPQMEREHRRYFRHPVELAVQLYTPRDEEISTGMVNVSEGGLAVNAGRLLKSDEIVTVAFEIPSTEPHSFTAKAQVVWSSDARTGITSSSSIRNAGLGSKPGLRCWPAKRTPRATIAVQPPEFVHRVARQPTQETPHRVDTCADPALCGAAPVTISLDACRHWQGCNFPARLV